MAALASLMPPLLVTVAVVAGTTRRARHRHLRVLVYPDPTTAVPIGGPGRAGAPQRAGAPRRAEPRVELSCRACGWTLDRPGWVGGNPTFAICDCCACEAGVDDVTLQRARDYRRRWIEHGAEWFDPGSRPESWDLYDHLCELATV